MWVLKRLFTQRSPIGIEVDHFGCGRTLGIGHRQDSSKLWAWKVSAHETLKTSYFRRMTDKILRLLWRRLGWPRIANCQNACIIIR